MKNSYQTLASNGQSLDYFSKRLQVLCKSETIFPDIGRYFASLEQHPHTLADIFVCLEQLSHRLKGILHAMINPPNVGRYSGSLKQPPQTVAGTSFRQFEATSLKRWQDCHFGTTFPNFCRIRFHSEQAKCIVLWRTSATLPLNNA